MPYMTSIERLIKEEGIQEGTLNTLQETIMDVLKLRFETIPSTTSEILTKLKDTTVLKQLHLQAIRISSTEEFQQLLDQYIGSELDNSAS